MAVTRTEFKQVTASGNDGQATAVLFGGSINNSANTMEPATDSLGAIIQVGYVRFPGVEVPQGVTIVSADLEIGVESTAEPAFNTVGTDFNVYADDDFAAVSAWRSQLASGATYSGDDVFRAPKKPLPSAVTLDITSAVQSLVNRPGWAFNNAMGVQLRPYATLIKGSTEYGNRFYASDAPSPAPTPNLTIQWLDESLGRRPALVTI